MSPEKVESFRQFTGADEETARSFLTLCGDNLEMAVGLYMDDPDSVQTNANGGAPVEEYRSPIPQRTERLIPMELPIYNTHPERGPLLRTRRRAFVADDSDDDDEIQVLDDESVTSNSENSARDTSHTAPTDSNSVQDHNRVPGTSSAQPRLPRGTSSSSTHGASGSGPVPVNGTRPVLGNNKRGYLRQLYQPPTELLFDGTLLAAQAAAREKNQWLLISLHDEGCFDCHLLNRDVWKDPNVYQTVKRNFTFLQIPVDSPEGIRFRSIHSYVQSASHISILNPYTGEQKMMWMHLKDPATVNEVLTEFIKHTKLQSSSTTDDASNSRACGSLDGLTSISAPSCLPGSRRGQTSPADHASPLKRPRLCAHELDPATLSSRVAAVSSQLASESLSGSHVPSIADPVSVPVTSPLDLSEEEQLRLAIEASKVETTVPKQKPNPLRSTAPSTTREPHPDNNEFIVLTDDEDSSADLDDEDSPATQSDCFIFDPEASSYSVSTSTAMISCRRPLRPSAPAPAPCSSRLPLDDHHHSSTVSTSRPQRTTSTAVPAPAPRPPSPQSAPQLPVPGPGEDAIELAVRLPDGHREVLRLPPSLQLQSLQRYFALRGFSQARYELVRLYPHRSLSALGTHLTLNEIGFAKKDTVFVQER